jgi:hypothetical protein
MRNNVTHRVEVEFQEFGWTALNEAAQRRGVTLEELVQHAAMYYLAQGEPETISHKILAAETQVSSGQL